MSKTYAIADLHGRFDLLEMALARITDARLSQAALSVPQSLLSRPDEVIE